MRRSNNDSVLRTSPDAGQAPYASSRGASQNCGHRPWPAVGTCTDKWSESMGKAAGVGVPPPSMLPPEHTARRASNRGKWRTPLPVASLQHSTTAEGPGNRFPPGCSLPRARWLQCGRPAGCLPGTTRRWAGCSGGRWCRSHPVLVAVKKQVRQCFGGWQGKGGRHSSRGR